VVSSVQPAFSFRSAGVSGELHRRNQPAFKPYASDQPVLKKIAGPTCHICVLPADTSFLPLCFARLKPPPLALDLAPPLAYAAAATPALACTPPSPTHAQPAPPPLALRPRATAPLHSSAARAPPPPAPPAPPVRRHHCYSCTAYRPRSSTPRRSRNRSTFSPSARQVLDNLPEPLFTLLSRRVRVPHTTSRDGS